MYQDGGIWSKALETANENDRIHLRSTHYNYAKHLESKGNVCANEFDSESNICKLIRM